MSIEQQFADTFRELTVSFQTSLPGRLVEIEATWDLTKLAGASQESIRKLHRLLHSLVGTSGTFGFKQLSEKARSLEYTVEALMATDVFSDEDLKQLEFEFGELRVMALETR